MCWGPYVPHFIFIFFLFFDFFDFFLYFFIFLKYFFLYLFLFFYFLFFYPFCSTLNLKNNKIIKKNTVFWGLQICPSSIGFMSVTNVSNEMK